jgi:glycosyltransferase involved in cell wall biosynthesis
MNLTPQSPLVSIVVVTYNRADLILESLQSVVTQTYPKWEMVVVDDGSTDNTFEIVKGLNDTRIHYHYVSHTAKLGYLRNLGMRLAKGDFIAFQDSDDLWRSDKLQFQLELFTQHPDIHYILTNNDQFGEFAIQPPSYDTEIIGALFKPLLIGKRFHFCSTSLIFRASVIGKIGMLDEDVPRIRELHFFFRMSHAFNGLFSNRRTVGVRRHQKNTSNTYQEKAHQTMLAMLDEFLSEGMLTQAEYKRLATDNLYALGLVRMKQAQPALAVQDFKTAIGLRPWRGKVWARLLQSVVMRIRS